MEREQGDKENSGREHEGGPGRDGAEAHRNRLGGVMTATNAGDGDKAGGQVGRQDEQELNETRFGDPFEPAGSDGGGEGDGEAAPEQGERQGGEHRVVGDDAVGGKWSLDAEQCVKDEEVDRNCERESNGA